MGDVVQNEGDVAVMPGSVVDVLITAYNAERTIRATLASILGQTFSGFRVIVVNDGSTDGTAAILDEHAGRDGRVQVVHQQRSGIVNSANRGLALCDAEFVARLDADDICFPTRLQKQLDHLAANPGCVAVSGACYHIDEDGRRTGYVVALDPPDLADPLTIPSREPYIMHSFLMARRDALLRVGGYRFADHAEDTDLYWRLQEVGRLDLLPDILGEYRLHTASVSSRSVINGRISAVNSQLSGLSAIRRRAGRPDIPFTRDDLPALEAGASLASMYDYASSKLDAAEAKYFRLALAAKMLELSAFRPYELEVADCHFIRAAMRDGLRDLAPGGLARVRAEWVHGAARLFSKGLLAEFRALAAEQIAVSAVVRAGRLRIEALFPRKFIIKLKMWRRRRRRLGSVFGSVGASP